MSRRRADAEAAIESDSFLDIVANIVGILLILIVVAGVRVSQAPIKPPDPVPPVEPTLDKPTAAPDPVLASLELRAAELEQQIATLREEIAEAEGGSRDLSARQRAESTRLGQVRSDVDRAGRLRELAQRDHEALRRHVAALDQEAARLEEQRAALERQPVPVRSIRHLLTPVSRTVEGRERHFRVANNRVSAIPLEDLVERIQDQIRRHREWLVRYRKHRGRVGPVAGYAMEFVVERQRLGVLEELKYGRGMVRIGVSRWTLEPEPDLETESIEQACRQGSMFYNTLSGISPETTLTFWVYEDSFAEYRRLQRLVQEAGFTVAARPLPPGASISGSPRGSKSAAQ